MISASTTVVAPMLGMNVGRFSGAYIVHPPLNVWPWKNETPKRSPENRYSQYDSAFNRGNARSSAPIWRGTM